MAKNKNQIFDGDVVKQAETASFERAVTMLEEAVQRLESGDLSLNDSLQVFEEGVLWGQRCQEHLSEAKQRVQTVMRKYDGEVELAKFDNETL